MHKTIKKTKKNSTQTTSKSDQVERERSLVKQGHTLIELSQADLEALIGLLNIASNTFAVLATSSAQTNDEKSYGVFSARAKLSKLFSDKLNSFNTVGEPLSKLSH